MNKVCFFADPHVAPRASWARKDDYRQTCFTKLAWIKNYCVEHKISLAVCLGDLFHHKDSSRTPYQLWLQLYNLFSAEENGFKVYFNTVIGNHDMLPSGMNSITSQPIWSLIETKALISQSMSLLYGAGITIWNWVSGDPEFIKKAPPSAQYNRRLSILATHAPLSDDGHYGTVRFRDVADLGYDYVFNGHMHEDDCRLYGRTQFINVPALLRYSIPTAPLTTAPAIYILSYDRGDSPEVVSSVERVEVPHAPAAEVFMLEEHERIKDRTAALVQFVTAAAALNLRQDTLHAAMEQLRASIPSEVFAVLESYL